jgi:hypothetical protein
MEMIPSQFYDALMLGGVAIIGAVVAYVLSILSRMKREQDARAEQNEQRDLQRSEIQENVRRIVNSRGVAHDDECNHWNLLLRHYLRTNALPLGSLVLLLLLALYQYRHTQARFQAHTEPKEGI